MTMHRSTHRSQIIKFNVYVSKADIHQGECRLPHRCMVKVAVERHLRQIDPNVSNHHSRVDGGHIRFNYEGYRYCADTPKHAKAALIQFDREEKAQRAAQREGREFLSKASRCRL